MTFAERLRVLIEEKDVTQREVAEQLHIALSTLNGYVNGYREPDFITLASLSKYFEVSTDYLLGLSDIPNSTINISDRKEQILLHYYTNLNPQMQNLLLDQAKLLSTKYNNTENL